RVGIVGNGVREEDEFTRIFAGQIDRGLIATSAGLESRPRPDRQQNGPFYAHSALMRHELLAIPLAVYGVLMDIDDVIVLGGQADAGGAQERPARNRPSDSASHQNWYFMPNWIIRLPLPPKILPEFGLGTPPSLVSAIVPDGAPRLKWLKASRK